ncbi:hypothetical protein [Pseudomonas aeruginosa]|uniref:hypothetical protein n=1 Tax=Pseudomonas aeruginosa TaxID=287 RepID=UPI0039063080
MERRRTPAGSSRRTRAGQRLLLRIDCEHICATFCAFGQAGVSAERVAEQVATQAIGWMESLRGGRAPRRPIAALPAAPAASPRRG